MKEILSALLQTVIIAAVPVCTAFVSKGLSELARYFRGKQESETAKRYITAAAEAAKKAVAYTNQVYVDHLKKSGTFTRENQKEALDMAVEKAASLLTEEAVKFLEMAYGDLTAYLAANIEAEVREQKYQLPC